MRVELALTRQGDLGLRLDATYPGGTLDALARCAFLVDLEEVLNLHPVERGKVMDVTQVLLPRVVERHAEHLVVAALLVAHPEHADRPAANQAARKRRLLDQYQCVERIAVVAERAL